MKKISIITIILLSSLFSSAQVVDKVKGLFIQKKSFTREDLKELENYEMDLSQITFYTSNEISIQRIIPREGKAIESTEGYITFDNDRVMSRVVITKGATGILTDIYEDSLKLKFENLEGYELTFVKDKRKNDIEHCYYLKVSDNRTILYGDEEWSLNWGNSTQLQWKNKETKKTLCSKKRIRGVKPDGTEKKTLKKHILGTSEEVAK